MRLQIVPEALAGNEDEIAIRISGQERRELADRLGRVPGKPLSEIIIEDRGDR